MSTLLVRTCCRVGFILRKDQIHPREHLSSLASFKTIVLQFSNFFFINLVLCCFAYSISIFILFCYTILMAFYLMKSVDFFYLWSNFLKGFSLVDTLKRWLRQCNHIIASLSLYISFVEAHVILLIWYDILN